MFILIFSFLVIKILLYYFKIPLPLQKHWIELEACQWIGLVSVLSYNGLAVHEFSSVESYFTTKQTCSDVFFNHNQFPYKY